MVFEHILLNFFQFTFTHIGFGLGVFKVLNEAFVRDCARGENQLFEFGEGFIDGNGLFGCIDTYNNGAFYFYFVGMQSRVGIKIMMQN